MFDRNDTNVMKNSAIERTIERLTHNQPNNLPNEAYRATMKAGWEDQWLNWDHLGDDDPDGWGDIGD